MKWITVVRAIITNKEGQVLIAKRARDLGAGKWALVGGKVDSGETRKEAIVREVKEELGIQFRPEKYIGFSTNELPLGMFWKVHYFIGTFDGVIQMDTRENSEYVFIDKEDIESYTFAFDHKEQLLKYFGSL